MSEYKTMILRSELATIRARYDSGAVSPAIYSVIRQIETEIAWIEYKRGVRPT
jgi:hypothetical protein